MSLRGAPRVDLREFGHVRAAELLSPTRSQVELHLRVARTGRWANLPAHQFTQRRGDDRGVVRADVVKVNLLPIRRRPRIAEVEDEACRQLQPAHARDIVFVEHQHAHTQLRPPDMGIEKRHAGVRAIHVVHERRQQKHQVALRHGKVVHHRHVRNLDGLHALECAVCTHAVHGQQTGRAAHAKIPQRAVRLDLGMGGKRHALVVVAPGLYAQRAQRIRIDTRGRAAFPQREHLVAVHHQARVGNVDAVRRGCRLHVRAGGAERRAQRPAGGGVGDELVGAHEHAAVRHALLADVVALDQAVAIKEMVITHAADLMPRRAISVERTAQRRREDAVHLCLAGRHVGADTLVTGKPWSLRASCCKPGSPRVGGGGHHVGQGQTKGCGAQGRKKGSALHDGPSLSISAGGSSRAGRPARRWRRRQMRADRSGHVHRG